MFKSYKTELNPTEKQIHTLNAYFKICVVAYNRFTSFNLNRLSNYKSFVSSSEYLNLIRKGTINDVGSELFLKREYAHAVAHTLENSEKTFRLFFSDKSNCIKEIVDLHPEFIAVEDLSVMSMVSDKRFAKFVSEEMFYEFRLGLFRKCKEEGIEFRVINKWIPSSKMCHECGFVRKKLSPDEREYVCPSCGVVVNRDYNASLNIRDALNYEVWH